MSASKNDPRSPDAGGGTDEAPAGDEIWSQLVAPWAPSGGAGQHPERAHRARRPLAEADSAEELVLGLIDFGVLAVDREANVTFATTAAVALLQGTSGLRLERGRLLAARVADQKLLLQLIEAALPPGRGESRRPAAGAMAIPRPRRMPLTAVVTPLPLPKRQHPHPAWACVMVRDPEHVQLDAGMLKSLFGFTSTESVVAKLLAEGKSVTEIATWQGVSEATVRTQVAKLLTKTHTARQGEVICLLWRCALPVRAQR